MFFCSIFILRFYFIFYFSFFLFRHFCNTICTFCFFRKHNVCCIFLFFSSAYVFKSFILSRKKYKKRKKQSRLNRVCFEIIFCFWVAQQVAQHRKTKLFCSIGWTAKNFFRATPYRTFCGGGAFDFLDLNATMVGSALDFPFSCLFPLKTSF